MFEDDDAGSWILFPYGAEQIRWFIDDFDEQLRPLLATADESWSDMALYRGMVLTNARQRVEKDLQLRAVA